MKGKQNEFLFVSIFTSSHSRLCAINNISHEDRRLHGIHHSLDRAWVTIFCCRPKTNPIHLLTYTKAPTKKNSFFTKPTVCAIHWKPTGRSESPCCLPFCVEVEFLFIEFQCVAARALVCLPKRSALIELSITICVASCINQATCTDKIQQAQRTYC